jgi:hypothetical protein
MRTDTVLAIALAFMVLPLPMSLWTSREVSAPSAEDDSSAPDDNPLPWFLTDVVIPDHLPPGVVLPSWVYEEQHGGLDISSLPDFNAMTVTEEQLEGPATARTTYPLRHNLSLSVSFEWDATVSEFQDMDGGLKRFSDFVYDYTDGQFTVGSFQLYNNKVNWNSVNIHVLNKSWYRANANPGGYYYNGIIQVGRDAWGQKWNTPMGAVTLAHEFGHYGLWLPDEYIEATQEPRCDNSTAGTCIMSNPYMYFELCTAESHNAQSTQDSHSCWWYIKDFYSDITEVHGVPDPGPTTGPGSTVTWHYPDLWVLSQEMTASSSKLNEGTNVTLTVPVHNGERLVSSSVTVRFYLDSANSANMIKAVYMNMAGQDAPAASCTWQAIGGTHTFIVVVDPDNQIKEMDDSNNQATKQLTVNGRPRFSGLPTGFISREDIPLTVNMTQYATDPEDFATALRWSVVKMDSRALASVSGQNSPSQTLTFNPVTHWSGTTSVILGVTDSGNLMSQKEVTVSFTFFNYAPQSMDPSVSPSMALRGKAVEVIADASDVEDRESDLTPFFEWRPNGLEGWIPFAGSFDGARFKAILTVPTDSLPGRADLRVSFQDTLQNRGPWAYLNSSLDVQNNRPLVDDIGLSGASVTRGGLVTVLVNASDIETAAQELQPTLEYMGADGEWQTIGAEGEYLGGSWRFQPNVNASWPVGAHDFRARVTDPDGGPSDWLVVSDALVVFNSDPVINLVRSTRTRMLRNESSTLTVTGEDYETPAQNLSIEFKAQDPRGKEQPGYLTKARWVNGTWEARFQVPPGAATGKYALSARIGDADGGWSAWKELPSTVEVGNNLPSASFTCPVSAVQGDIVRFDGAGSADIEDPLNLLTFSWSFGDGSGPGIGQLATHSFPKAGAFRVTLIITDRDGGTATAQQTVSVTERPAAPIGGGGTGTWLTFAVIVIIVAAAAGAYIFMQKRKAAAGAKPPRTEPAQVAAPQAPAQYVPLYAQTGEGDSEQHHHMGQCRQTHAEQRRAAANAEAHEAAEAAKDPEASGATFADNAAWQPGPYPEPSPMPGPEPDPLRPAEPEPGPGPYPEPDDDDEDQ